MRAEAFNKTFDSGYVDSDAVADDEADYQAAQRHRSIFLSDVHLGTRASQANDLLDFLRCNDADTIYLVGDIVDF